MDLAFATATETVAALRERAVSSRELLDDMLVRIEEVNPRLNAVVALDRERAGRAAARADEALVAGRVLGPLHGLIMTVKDVWATEGLVTTSGALQLADYVPEDDAPVIARLRHAGAIIVGKTNTPIWAGDDQTFNEVYGQTNNPWDLDRSTGGSSGGAAAAVAAGLTPLELGSDIGGSIRAPAHFCGIYGLKPSFGIIPTRGYLPPAGDLVEEDVNCAGPLARSLDDLRLSLDVVAGPDADDATAWSLDLPTHPVPPDLASLRIATAFDDDDFPPSGAVHDVLAAFADRLASAGARVEPTGLPVSVADGFRTWMGTVLPTIGTTLDDETFAAFTALDMFDDPDLGIRAGKALVSRYRDYRRADEQRQRQRLRWAGFFQHHDVVLAPVMPVAAFPHDNDRPFTDRVLEYDGRTIGHLEVTAWCGAIGTMLLPVVVIPAGHTPDGLPVGVQIIGPYLHDRRLLALAELIDQVGPGFTPPPGY
jgi:amidase